MIPTTPGLGLLVAGEEHQRGFAVRGLRGERLDLVERALVGLIGELAPLAVEVVQPGRPAAAPRLGLR